MGVNDCENYEIKITSSTSQLDLELLQEVFEKFESNVILDSYEEAQGSGRGDNYTAALYRISLKGYTKSNEDNKKSKWEKSVICKRLPDCKVRREAYKSEALFRNEVEFYTSILPELINFEKKKNKDQTNFKAVPQCFLAQNDLLLLEDLCVRKFTMPDRLAGLELEQMKSVLVELAKFHALSLAYKAQHPNEFIKLTKKICEGIFSAENEDWYRNYYEALTKNAIEMVTDTLAESSLYVTKLREFSDSLFTNMVDLVNKETNLSVICHGDCWTNNILYRYNENGEIMETCFVDFQLIRYGSLALDLANVIFCCTDSPLRKNHLQSLLKFYCSQLMKSMKLLGTLPDFCQNEETLWDNIQNEFKTYGKFGLGLAMDMLPISTCLSEEAPDLYASRSDSGTGAPKLNVPTNEICRQKMTDLVIDLVDAGML